MQHKVKLTVLDKKLYPDLQASYCKDPLAGECPIYNIGDEYIFERYNNKDDFWHMGINTIQSTPCNQKVAGDQSTPHCSEAWDAISRYIYTGLQGGSIMRNWMKDERVMITCCNDGTRPVIFKVERLDYLAIYLEEYDDKIIELLNNIDEVLEIEKRDDYIEVYVERDIDLNNITSILKNNNYNIIKID